MLDTALQIPPTGSLREEARASICLERFRTQSNPSDAFHLREAKEACTLSDAILSQHRSPIFLIRAGHSFRIRIRYEYDAPVTLPSPRVSAVYARVDEGEYVALDTERMRGKGRTMEVMALVEPARLLSPRLLVASPNDGSLAEKYVKLDIVLEAASSADADRGEARQHVIYCKVLPRSSRTRYHRFRNKWIDVWHRCGPQDVV